MLFREVSNSVELVKMFGFGDCKMKSAKFEINYNKQMSYDLIKSDYN